MNQVEKQLKAKPRGRPWPKGVSGNLAGRPRGELNKFSLAVNPEAESKLRKYDARQPAKHEMHKGRWYRTIKQDNLVFCRDCGVLWGAGEKLRKRCACGDQRS